MSELFRRSMELRFVAPEDGDEKNAKDNRISVIASTENPVEMWGVREILSHADGAIDSEGACSVLFNHDPDQPVGAIAEKKTRNKILRADLDIDPEAKARSGVSILKAIRNKSVQGISIGYDYRKADCVVTEDEGGKKTITVNRWRLVEISLTPTPADPAASVSARHRSFLRDVVPEGVAMDFNEWLKVRGFNPETMAEGEKALLKKAFDAEPKGASKDEISKEREAREVAERAAKESKAVAEQALLSSELIELARSYGLLVEAKDVQGLTREQGKDLILKRLAVEAAARINPTTSQVSEDKPDGRDFMAEVAAYQRSNPKSTFETAAKEVSKANPKLHGEYVEKCRAGGSAKARR